MSGLINKPILIAHPNAPAVGRTLEYIFDDGAGTVEPYYMKSDGIPRAIRGIEDHTLLTNIGVKTHATLDTEVDTNTTNNTGTVTVHNDVTSAGSGDIITSVERTAISTLAADSGKVQISSNDTTPDFLHTKLTSSIGTNTSNPIQLNEINDGANETLDMSFDEDKLPSIPVLKQMLSTGWQGTPPVLTVNGGDPDLFDHTSGILEVIDNSVYPPAISILNIAAATGITPALLATNTTTFISFGAGGTLISTPTRLTPEQRRDEASVGLISHINNVNIDSIVNTPQIVTEPSAQTHDLIRAIGFFSTSGNQVIGVPASLTINKATGSGFALHENAGNNVKDPHNFIMPALTPATMIHITQNVTVDHIGAIIDPTIYDNAGVVTTVPLNNNATIGRIYAFPNNSIIFMLGQEVFSTFSLAKDTAGNEVFILPPDIASGALLLARVILKKSAVDITTTGDAEIITASAISGGGASLTSLAQAYQISTEPEIPLDATRGAVSYQMYAGGNATTAIEVLNDASTITFSVDGDGNIVTSGTVDGRDVDADGTKLDGIEPLAQVTKVPVGGLAGQVLEKVDGTDYNSQWATPASGVTDHLLLSNIGVKTHATLDTEVGLNNAKVGITPTQASDITANNAKVTNVTTDLATTHNASTVVVTSSDGTDATINAATSVTAGIMSEAIYDDHVLNNAKVTNATHTGEVTGSGVLTVDKTSITNKTTVTAVSGDFLLISDTGDTGNLKKVDALDFLGAAPVDSVNGQTGVVVLDADDISDAATTNKFATAAELAAITTNTTNNTGTVTVHNDVTSAGSGDIITGVERTKLTGIEPLAQVTKIPTGGLGGQILEKVDGTDYNTQWATSAAGVTDHLLLSNIGVKSHITLDAEVSANNAKVTNVTTDLAYTTAASTGTVTSSDGTDATLPAATTSLAGLQTGADKTKLDGIDPLAQVTKIPTGGLGGQILEKVDGTDYNIQWATSAAGVTDHLLLSNIGVKTHATLDTEVGLNNAKVTNATHTGEVTGSGVLTVDKTAITNKTTVTPVSGDFVLISDTGDTGNLKKVDVVDLIETDIVFTALSTDTTLTSSHSFIKVDTSGGDVTLTLPSSASIARSFNIWKTSSDVNKVIIARAGSDTIIGDTTFEWKSQYSHYEFVSDSILTWFVK